ncbi:P-loop containing nucleoside triphosphate hydrolase protein [Lentinus brumalis]|uniref:DNA 3'-5' helicase n=1 Tax=Lentinus brumalis TaxID=2498619 RepID=A0A371D053_9APHY|nr:P-loop containing nucleoside triphosphate hydrolase protein [Polyporus brumalis]
MHSEPRAASIAPSISTSEGRDIAIEPTPVIPPVSHHVHVRERSYKLLEDARIRARDAKKYSSHGTRQTMIEQCQKRANVTPYPEQLDLAECMLLGLDATSIAGTGWGKTLTFVLPLFVPQSKGKMVIIVSPLNALEDDQAERFKKMGLKAVALNGDTNTPELLKDIEKGTYDVILVGPKLLTGERSTVRDLLSKPHFNRRVLGFVIDEAHCICQWGGSFRQEYSQLAVVRALLSTVTSILVTSATMTPVVLENTWKSVLIDPEKSFVLNLGNDRRNIEWRVESMTAGKADLGCLQFLVPENVEELISLPKTMVFFDDIFQSQKARRWLLERLPKRFHERVKCYNARLGDQTKKFVMKGFRKGTIDILLTTEAAGMGCDIPDIVRVVQYMTPESLGVWIQRAGRAGRSPGIRAVAILLVETSVFAEKGKKDRKEGDTITYVKTLEPGLRKYVDAPEDQCRRDIVDEYFDNPPGRRGMLVVCASISCAHTKHL